jgi:hypothetical protein
LVQTKGVQHLGGALKRYPRTLPSNGHGGEEDGDESILPPRQTVARVPSDLQNELPVSAFMQETTSRRSFHGQTAEDEWAGRESEVLLFTCPVLANHLDCLDLAQAPFGND